MHAIERRLHQQLEQQFNHALEQQIRTISHEILSLGVDTDGRRLHWLLARDVPPQQRLEFALAVYFTHGRYVMITAERGFLCVEKIAQSCARLIKARQSGSYLVGHAFAGLLDALGYADDDTAPFCLIEDGDLANPQGFIKGFSVSVAQSLEWDVLRIVRSDRQTAHGGPGLLVENLRNYVANKSTFATIPRSSVR